MINFTTSNSTILGQFLILLTIISYYSTISVVDAFAAPSTKLDPVTYLRTEWVSFVKDMFIYVTVSFVSFITYFTPPYLILPY